MEKENEKNKIETFERVKSGSRNRLQAGRDDLRVEEQGQEVQLPYPKAVVFLLICQFISNMASSGKGSIILLYLTHYVGTSDDQATTLIHSFFFLRTFVGIFGALIADSWWGRYKSIRTFTLILLLGSLLLFLTSTSPLNMPRSSFTSSAQTIWSIGYGLINPNIVPFHGDQFILPQQKRELERYFSIYFFFVNFSSAMAILIMPVLRGDAQCFGEFECFPLPLGLCHILEVLFLVIFISGKKFYIKKPPIHDIIGDAGGVICNAISTRCKERKTNPRQSWLDYANEKYDKQLIADMKAFFHILILFLPVPFFWSLFNQQGSRWTLQATQMDGRIGSWEIKPDQMSILNPLFILIFIPLCEYLIYPALKIIGIQRSLQKLVLGGFLAGVSFIVAGLLELELLTTYPQLPSLSNAQVRIFNCELCDYTFTTNIIGQESFSVKALDFYVNKDVNIPEGVFQLTYELTPSQPDCPTFEPGSFNLKEEKAYSLFMGSKNPKGPLTWYEDVVNKPHHGHPHIRTLTNINPGRKVKWQSVRYNQIEHEEIAYANKLIEFTTGNSKLLIDGMKVYQTYFKIGGVYTILVHEDPNERFEVNAVEVTSPNSIHMLWQIPQYVILTLGEVMFSVKGMQFMYMQAPLSMKSLVRAFYLLMMGIGNILVVFVTKMKIVSTQAEEFFLFASVMIIHVVIFMFLAYFYKPNNPEVK